MRRLKNKPTMRKTSSVDLYHVLLKMKEFVGAMMAVESVSDIDHLLLRK